MDYYIASFRSRAESIKLKELMLGRGIFAEIINTPKEVGVGCGLSVKFEFNQINNVRYLISSNRFSSFAGVFAVKVTGKKRVIRGI